MFLLAQTAACVENASEKMGLKPCSYPNVPMSLLSIIRVALAALLLHKTRSALTCLGIVVGVGAVVALVSAATGARRKLEDRLATVGSNLILIRAGASTNPASGTEATPLTRADADALRKQVGHLLAGVAEFQLVVREVASREHTWRTPVTGSTPDMQRLRGWKVVHGRFYTDEDLRRQAAVCVLGETVRSKLFSDVANPVGETVRIGPFPLRVIGVLGAKGRNPAGVDQDDEILMPITTLQRRLVGEDRIDVILTAARSESLTDAAVRQISQVLRVRYRVSPGTESFHVASVRELAELGFRLMNTLGSLVVCVAGVSLLVGGIGIMNIILASVKERTAEIGLRVAVGATPADVLAQFVLEAVVLALGGGLLGVTAGLSVAAAVAWYVGWPLVVSPAVLVLAFAVTAAVGVCFGFYPAWKASRLPPVVALGHE
jgi:putative ABC transport system permease protein